MHTYARAQDEILKELFPRVSPRGLGWEDKRYELKGSFCGTIKTTEKPRANIADC